MVAMAAVSNPCLEYAEGVLSGEIPACRLVKLACQRFLDWLERDDIYFDLDEANLRFEFFSDYLVLDHGEPFELGLWQKFAVGNIFAWRYVANDRRVIREAFIMVPRKNAKTTLGAGISLSSFVLDGEARPNTYCVACDRGQASLLTKYSKSFVKKNEELSGALRVRVHDILNEELDGEFKALHADTDRLDGLNPYVVFGDEAHAWKGRGPYDVINSGFGARDEPLFIIITTAGVFDPTKVCIELYDDAISILEGKVTSDSLFALIYTVDDVEKPFDVEEWKKANPDLGRAKRMEFMVAEADKAARLPSLLNDFKTKQLNIWTKQLEAWIPPEAWDACDGVPVFDEEAPCFGALDCANTLDFNSFSLYWPDTHSLKTWFWLPEFTVLYRAGRYTESYKNWVKRGLISVEKDATAMDKRIVTADIAKICERYNVRSVGYDKAKDGLTVAVELANDFDIEMVGFAQTPMNFNEPSREFEQLVFNGLLRHGNNPVLNWHASNVCKKTNASDLIMPARGSEYVKIDGIVTAIMAIGGSMVEDDGTSVYETRDIRMV